MMNEECGVELERIVECDNGEGCKDVTEKAYVNCVIQKICPLETNALLRENCVAPGTLDLNRYSTKQCLEKWQLMDECLTRATEPRFALQRSSLKPRI
jgi:hypothetical protein